VKTVAQLVQELLPDSRWKELQSYYKHKNVIVTGGASFIGSNLVEILYTLGSKVTVIDDLSSGKLENIPSDKGIVFIEGDLRDRSFAFRIISDAQIVFHLAAVHGGRGFIETYKQEMLVNLAIDNNVFSAAVKSGVSIMIHASSACAYPINLQEVETNRHLLSENEASMDAPDKSFADGVYGWTKLIGEYQLQNHCSSDGMKGRSARIFTSYGEKENESHAAVALIAKAIMRADPYPIWGSGQQTRNFTHVADTALGLILLGFDDSKKVFDVFNIGTSEHIKVIDFVESIFKQLNWRPKSFNFQLDKPTGVASRASDNSKIIERFDWAPKIGIDLGISRTLSWYLTISDRPKTLIELEKRLSSR
jgi:nucleoside-diphosphate-sugar epimerase